MDEDKHELKKADPDLFNRVVAILEKARTTAVRSINNQMVIAYWLIGREIVEEEQKGSSRAEYGRRLIEGLSMKLMECYGSGFSVANLKNFRQFYLTFRDCVPQIGYPPGSQSPSGRKIDMMDGVRVEKGITQENSYPMESQSKRKFHPDLSWSHYRALMRVESPEARSFYEIETVRNRWNRRQLERQISSLLFERLLKSRDKKGVMRLANEGHVVEKPLDAIKDPYVLEFLDLPVVDLINELDKFSPFFTTRLFRRRRYRRDSVISPEFFLGFYP